MKHFEVEDGREEKLSGRGKLKVEQVERRGDAVDAQSSRGDKKGLDSMTPKKLKLSGSPNCTHT